MRIQPCAKINLGLNIVARRADGYHNLETVFYPVPIHDEITIEERPDDGRSRCLLTMNVNPIDGDPVKNLVVRAYHQLAQRYSYAGWHGGRFKRLWVYDYTPEPDVQSRTSGAADICRTTDPSYKEPSGSGI